MIILPRGPEKVKLRDVVGLCTMLDVIKVAKLCNAETKLNTQITQDLCDNRASILVYSIHVAKF